MQPEIQISLVIPVGSQAGPFDLYSDVDGYAVPFETDIDASEFVAPGYITTPPDGTDYVKVQSNGVTCKTFIVIKNICQPTTTTTTSSSTSTTTSTTTIPPTTTTILIRSFIVFSIWIILIRKIYYRSCIVNLPPF